jgi:hypothetical protein
LADFAAFADFADFLTGMRASFVQPRTRSRTSVMSSMA